MLVFCTVEMNTSDRPEASAIEQHTSKGKILLKEAYSCKDDTKFDAAIEVDITFLISEILRFFVSQ